LKISGDDESIRRLEPRASLGRYHSPRCGVAGALLASLRPARRHAEREQSSRLQPAAKPPATPPPCYF